jgi:hypothetical protein
MSATAPGARADIQVFAAVPTFPVAVVGSTARWYAQYLGFQTTGHVPDHEPLVYASLQRDGAEVMLSAQADGKQYRPTIYKGPTVLDGPLLQL